MKTAPLSVLELQRRLVFSLLRPAARLSRLFRLPLKTIEELCRLAYFEELRRGGEVRQADVARIFGRSLRTVVQLEREYRDNFLAPEHEVERTRRIEDALDGGPLDPAEVARRLGDDADAVGCILEGLAAAGRVARDENGRYVLNRAFVSLVGDDFGARIDGLNHQLDVVTAAVVTRFLDGARPTVARTLSFVAAPEDVERLGQALARAFREVCGEAEDEALRKRAHGRWGATFALAPMDAIEDRET